MCEIVGLGEGTLLKAVSYGGGVESNGSKAQGLSSKLLCALDYFTDVAGIQGREDWEALALRCSAETVRRRALRKFTEDRDRLLLANFSVRRAATQLYTLSSLDIYAPATAAAKTTISNIESSPTSIGGTLATGAVTGDTSGTHTTPPPLLLLLLLTLHRDFFEMPRQSQRPLL